MIVVSSAEDFVKWKIMWNLGSSWRWDCSSRFIRNVGTYLPKYTASHPKRSYVIITLIGVIKCFPLTVNTLNRKQETKIELAIRSIFSCMQRSTPTTCVFDKCANNGASFEKPVDIDLSAKALCYADVRVSQLQCDTLSRQEVRNDTRPIRSLI
jgi:hypothetical protein